MKAILTAALLTATALPATAFDPAKMSEAEKAAFGDAVRDYLMANPEVLVESINVMEERRVANEAKNDQLLVEANKDAIFNDGHSWVGGNPNGDVTMVEFVDYRCGYCKKVNPEVEALLKEDGNIRFILKEFPILTQESDLAAQFAVAVQQINGADAYKTMHDALIAARGPISIETLSALAKDQGLDPQPLVVRMNAPEVMDVLRKNRQLAEQMRIMGTPTFIINGEMLRGIPGSGLAGVVADVRAKQQG